MPITRSPTLNNRRKRATAGQSAVNNRTAPASPQVMGRRNRKRVTEDASEAEAVGVHDSAGEGEAPVLQRSDIQEEEGKPDLDIGSDPSESSPGDSMPKAVGKLRESAYRPFGNGATPSNSVLRSSSDSESETAYCRGGPGKPTCGDLVKYGDKGIKCDRCLLWFHASCQSVSDGALSALDHFKEELSWLCDLCKATVPVDKTKGLNQSSHLHLVKLENQVEEIGATISTHMKLIIQSLKEQEKAVNDNTKLVERSIAEDIKQKSSYAEIVRGSCNSVLREVTKISDLPKQGVPTNPVATHQDISKVFDSCLDKEKRKLNVVIHNLPETEAESLTDRAQSDQEQFRDLVKDCFRMNIRTSRSFRAGKKIDGKPRLLIITLENIETKLELLKMAPQLRHHERGKNIFVTPDLTREEREEGKKLREELKARRQAGESNITIRRGRIVVATSVDTSQLTGAQTEKAGDGKASRDGFMSQRPVPSDGEISARDNMASEQAPQPSDRASQQSQI